MTRSTPLTALASVALVPISRLLATATPAAKPDNTPPEKGLAATITELERTSWDAFKSCDAEAWSAVCADASYWTKEQALDDIRSRAWETHSYTMSEIHIVPMNESAALITYMIDASFTWHTSDEVTGKPVDKPYTTSAYATSVYAKVGGRWQGFIYQETGVPGTGPSPV